MIDSTEEYDDKYDDKYRRAKRIKTKRRKNKSSEFDEPRLKNIKQGPTRLKISNFTLDEEYLEDLEDMFLED